MKHNLILLKPVTSVQFFFYVSTLTFEVRLMETSLGAPDVPA